MGAEVFAVVATGDTAQKAFNTAVMDARYAYGNGGYTGSIAEKGSFVLIPPPPEGVSLRAYVNQLIDDGDPRVDDKWGPAGCIEISPQKFCFFGWASS